MELRARTADDLEAVASLAARVQASDGYPHYLPDQNFVRFLTRPEPLCAWVAEIAGTVVGHVAINAGTSSRAVMQLVRDDGIEGEVMFIARLLVDPDLRRRGLGTRLLEHARREVIARGGRPALDVVLTASAAISLYRAAGWREIGRSVLNLPDGCVLEELVFLGPDQ